MKTIIITIVFGIIGLVITGFNFLGLIIGAVVGLVIGLFGKLISKFTSKLSTQKKAHLSQEQYALYMQYKELRKNIFFFCIGGAVLIFSILYSMEFYFGFSYGVLFRILFSLAIIGWPLRKGLTALSNAGVIEDTKADYEVVTTYADGRKESDKGAESTTNKAMGNIFVIIGLMLASPVIQLIRIIVMSKNYKSECEDVQQKPKFKPSVAFLNTLTCVILFGTFIVVSSYTSGKFDPILDPMFDKEQAVLNRPTATVIADRAVIYKDLNMSRLVRKLNKGDVVYVTGNMTLGGVKGADLRAVVYRRHAGYIRENAIESLGD